jgi:hypothetical protein
MTLTEIVLCILYVSGVCIGFIGGQSSIKQEAVKQGVAEYNSTNAVFQWKSCK